jgi:hypothetical protein
MICVLCMVFQLRVVARLFVYCASCHPCYALSVAHCVVFMFNGEVRWVLLNVDCPSCVVPCPYSMCVVAVQGSSLMGVWQQVAMHSLKYHQGPTCPTLLCPVGGPPLKRPYGRYRGGPPAGHAAVFYPLYTPTRRLCHHSVLSCQFPSCLRLIVCVTAIGSEVENAWYNFTMKTTDLVKTEQPTQT